MKLFTPGQHKNYGDNQTTAQLKAIMTGRPIVHGTLAAPLHHNDTDSKYL